MVKSDFRVSSDSEVSSTLKQRECDREVADEPAPVTETFPVPERAVASDLLSALYREQPKLQRAHHGPSVLAYEATEVRSPQSNAQPSPLPRTGFVLLPAGRLRGKGPRAAWWRSV